MLRLASIALFVVSLALPQAACSGTRDVRTPGAAPGCATAIIVPENRFNRQRAAGPFGVACDGGQVLVRVCGQQLNGKSRFRVPAGQQTLQVAYTEDETPLEEKVLATMAIPITFNAEAGKTYAVRGNAVWRGSTPTVTLWIVDGTTGQTVTSVVVPQENVRIEDEGWAIV